MEMKNISVSFLKQILKMMDGFADAINFFCYEGYVITQAYVRKGDCQILADMQLSPASSGGLLKQYSCKKYDRYFLSFNIKELSKNLGHENVNEDGFITIKPGECDYVEYVGHFWIEFKGKVVHTFKQDRLNLTPQDRHFLSQSNDEFQAIAKLPVSDFSRCFSQMVDLRADSVEIGVPKPGIFEISKCGDDAIPKVQVRAETPDFVLPVAQRIELNYLKYFIIEETTPPFSADVTISLGSDRASVVVGYSILDKDSIRFYYSPMNKRVKVYPGAHKFLDDIKSAYIYEIFTDDILDKSEHIPSKIGRKYKKPLLVSTGWELC